VHASLRDDPGIADDFKSDEEAGLRATAREKRIPELREGRSVYGSLAMARLVWGGLKKIADDRGQPVKVGYHIAEVRLVPDAGFSIEDLGEPDEHLTIWGDRFRLAEAVSRVYAVEIDGR
jgi:hypothetical protein